MNFVFNIAVYSQTSNAIRDTIVTLMKEMNFDLANKKLVVQILHSSPKDILDKGLMLRNFVVSPNKNNWCVVYPSTGWVSEMQGFSRQLSGQLQCVTLLILQDDSAGWGYELSNNGHTIDLFHTLPLESTSFQEKQEELSELGMAVDNSEVHLADYTGNPVQIAELFNVDQARVSNHLSKSRDKPGIRSHFEMGELLYDVLGIDKWGWAYDDVRDKQENTEGWHHLVFVRQMTQSEKGWREQPRNQFSYISPPLWLNEL